jgi:hypothetical protein
MQEKKSVQYKLHGFTTNPGQDSKYIYNDEPVDWPTNNRGKVRDNICICPNCGSITDHKYGLSCLDTKCLKCGTQMRAR